MKKSGYFPIFTITLSIFLTIFCIAAFAKEVEVQIHIVQGSGITQEQATGYVAEANRIDGPAGVTYTITSRHNYEPNTPYDPNKNDPCKINIWGVKRKPWGTPTVSGKRGNVIWLVPDYIRPSTLAHELDHVLGLDHSNDPNNKMYPDNVTENGTVIKTGERKGTKLTEDDINDIRNSNVAYVQNVCRHGAGAESYDVLGDVLNPNIDLVWTQGWIEYVGGKYMVHLTAEVDVVSFFDVWPEIGFYMNSDGDDATGEPPDGLDCILTYRPYYNEITLQKFEPGLGWHYAPTEGISYELTYADDDSNLPPRPTGIVIGGSLETFWINQFVTGLYEYLAKATDPNTGEQDRVPDSNSLKLKFPAPAPLPGDLNLDKKVDAADLDIMSWDWPEIGTSRADIEPIPAGDGKVDFLDFAILAQNWLIWIP
jgi:hypothetical protein